MRSTTIFAEPGILKKDIGEEKKLELLFKSNINKFI